MAEKQDKTGKKLKQNRKLKGKIILFKGLQKHFHLWGLRVYCLRQALILKGTKWLPSSDALER